MVRRGKKFRTLADINQSDEEHQEREERFLPPEVLALIFSRLNLRENIIASAVSTRWLTAAVSVRRTNSTPLLMYIPRRGDLYEFYDPASSSFHIREIPEIRASRILFSSDGWLLLNHTYSLDLFFFCPFDRSILPISRPWGLAMPLTTAFTASPLSTSCTVFSLSQTNNYITVALWRQGWNLWKTSTFSRPLQYFYCPWVQITYTSGCFFCLNQEGQLGIFEPDTFTWAIHYIQPPVFWGLRAHKIPWQARFMAAHAGEVFVVCTSQGSSPVVYRLGLEDESEWLPVESLEGVALFANSLTSLARGNVVLPTAGRIVFSKVKLHGARCVMYSPGLGRYYPDAKELLDWRRDEPYESIWIDVPEITPELRGLQLGAPEDDGAAAHGSNQ